MIGKIPLVSVIMNCYNGEKYLKDSINSVFAQEYQNWEIILWDNCSTDSSALIVSAFEDKRIRYFRAVSHTSLGEARNLAMAKAEGRYIAFLDTDDVWFSSFLSRGITAFQQSEDISIFYSNYYQFNDQSKWLINKMGDDHIYGFSDLLRSYTIGMSASIVDNGFLKKEGISFNNAYSLVEDYDFFLRIAHLKSVYYCSEPLMLYRMHNGSLTFQMKVGWGKELTDLFMHLTTVLMTSEEIEQNATSLRWLRVRIVNAKINEAIEVNRKREVFRLIYRNFFLSYKLLFPLLFLFTTKERYYEVLYRVRGSIYRIQ
ncbi:MAG: glycosyltransferase [Odoribacter sp.]